MGLFGSLFGKTEPASVDRCMECGMTEGRHTEWCPSTPEEGTTPATPGGSDRPGAEDIDGPPSG